MSQSKNLKYYVGCDMLQKATEIAFPKITVVNARGSSLCCVQKDAKATRYNAKKFEISMDVTPVAQGFEFKLTTVFQRLQKGRK